MMACGSMERCMEKERKFSRKEEKFKKENGHMVNLILLLKKKRNLLRKKNLKLQSKKYF